MENVNLQRREELAASLLAELGTASRMFRETATAIENESGTNYEAAFTECREELDLVMEDHRRNLTRIREIDEEIAESIKCWNEFVINGNKSGKLLFPVICSRRRHALQKRIVMLNAEISNIEIKNRCIKEKLTILEHQTEIKAMSLARSGISYQNFDKLWRKQSTLSAELRYLLPTIQTIE